MAGDVPPPPQAPPIVSRSSAGSTAHSASSSSTHQQINADPTRSTGVERHSGNTKAYKLGAENSTVAHVTAHADALAKEGKLQEAQELLEKYDKTYPKNAAIDSKLSQISLERAKYYVRHDDYVEGAKQARIALAHNSSNTEAKHVLDQVLRHHGIEPSHSHSRVKIGDVLFSQGKLKEARVEYEAALKSDHSTAAYIGLGNISLRENKLKEAKSDYQLALEKEPESSVALRQLGIVRYKLKDVVGANTDLSRALVINQDDKLAGQTLVELWQRQVSMRPKDANSHLGLARAYQLSGDLKSAQNAYRTVVSIEPNHPNLPAARQSFKLALARQEAQKTYEAAKTLDAGGAVPEAYNKASESVSLSPGDLKFRLYQAELAERLGNAPEAKHLYLEILRQDPKNTLAAQKVKSLSEMLSGNDTTHALRGPIGLMQQGGGLQAQTGALDAIAQGASPGSVASALGTPRGRIEGPALATLPGAPGATGAMRVPSADPVQNMSGFLGELRNYMVVQKKGLQKQEDAVLDAINGRTKSESAGSIAAAGDLPPLAGVPDLPKNMISSSDVQKLLAQAGSKPSSSAAGIAAGAAAGVAGAAASALTAPKGATSAQDISNFLAGGSTAGGAGLSSSLPPLDSASSAGLSNKLPAGLSMQDVTNAIGAGGFSSPLRSSPPLSVGNAPSAMEQFTSQTAVNDSLLSAPTRRSETVLKVADAPETIPPVAPSRFGSAAPVTAPSFSAPQAAYSNPTGFSVTPPAAGIDVSGLAAQAQQLSPQALSGIARSLGMDPAAMQSMASQALQQAPQLMNAAPGLINKGLANLKQEDIDKYAKILKEHVAKQQAALGSAKGTTKEIVTTKATPQMVKKVNMAKADPKATKIATAKTATKSPAKAAVKPATASKTAIASKPAPATPASTRPISVPNETAPSNFAVPQAESESTATAIDATATAAGLTAGALAAVPIPADSNSQSVDSAIAPDVPAPHGQRLDSLEAQNKDLISQLEDTRKELQMLRDSMFNQSLQTAQKIKPPKTPKAPKAEKAEKVKPTKESKTVETQAPPTSGAPPALKSSAPQPDYTAETAARWAHSLARPNPGTLVSSNDGTQTTPHRWWSQGFSAPAAETTAQNATDLTAPMQAPSNFAAAALSGMQPAAIPQFAQEASPNINLELAGVNVRPKGVRLNVVLRNGTGQALEIPTTTKAVVRMVGVPDQLAEVKFPVKSITAGEEARGYISVSGHKLDPSADVFIPKLLSTASGTRDVHLSVPISALTGEKPN
jgi:tetratricopeptide (TPR) repeat protein